LSLASNFHPVSRTGSSWTVSCQPSGRPFLEVVAGKRPSPCTVADGLEADWIAEACSKSWKEHRPVWIEEVRNR
jgi:hypothetical protein